MIKPRKPDKIKPGTPHPTKAYTVRGFNGRWITTKSYHADRRRREKAAKEAKETKSTSKTTKSTSKTTKSTSKTTKSTSKTTPKKGGSLVKRVSSALTKTSNKAGDLLKVNKGALTKVSDKAGELLKIKKGDKGLVRGVKDLYKMGKDTRKSADALYNAGKITRQVYDKLVKGTKDFFGGVKESGKATRRVVNALKPGGKLVAQAKKFNGVNYDLIPKSIRGALVKVSKDGGKSKTFKFDYSKIPTDLQKKTPTSYKAPTIPDRKKVERNKSLKTKITDKAKSVKRNLKNTKLQYNKDVINRPLANLKLRIGKPNQINLNPNSSQVTNPIKNRALQISKSLNPRFTAGGLKALGGGLLQGAKGYGICSTLDWAAQELLDRGMRNIEGKQKMSIDDYRAMRDKRFKDLKSKTTWWGGVKKDPSNLNNQPNEVITKNRRGRVTSRTPSDRVIPGNTYTQGKKGNLVRVTERMKNEQDILNFLENQKTNPVKEKYVPKKETPGPNQGTDSTKKETVDQPKVKVVKKQPNSFNLPASKVKIGTTKKESKKEGKSKEQIAWEKKTRNSPARKSKAFTDKQLWEQQKKHREWLKKRKKKLMINK